MLFIYFVQIYTIENYNLSVDIFSKKDMRL